MNKLVSIITPAYNSTHILKTYESINNQTYDNWEWVITDDYSSDNTFLTISSIVEANNLIKVFQNKKNSGAAVSRNNSIFHSTGDFIAFIDSDDLWLPNKLEKQVAFMEEKNIDFSFTAYELINAHGEPLGKKVDTHLTEPLTYEDMLRKKATLGCSTVMLRRSAFEDISMPLLRTGQDYALWLKLLRTGAKAKAKAKAYPLPEVLTQYRILPNSISRNKFKKAMRQWEIYREVEMLPLLKSIECFCYYAYRAVFR